MVKEEGGVNPIVYFTDYIFQTYLYQKDIKQIFYVGNHLFISYTYNKSGY